MSLLLLMFLPLLIPEWLGSVGVPITFTVVMLLALAGAADTQRQLLIGVILVVPVLILNWMAELRPTDGRLIARGLLTIGFMLYVASALLRHVVRAKQVDAEILFAALCLYFLLAFIWGSGYAVLEVAEPGSFAGASIVTGDSFDRTVELGWVMYFSFVTLTTLGYGDISPIGEAARVIAITEAALGQLFLVTLVARLVSLYSSPASEAAASAAVEEPPR